MPIPLALPSYYGRGQGALEAPFLAAPALLKLQLCAGCFVPSCIGDLCASFPPPRGRRWLPIAASLLSAIPLPVRLLSFPTPVPLSLY